MHLSYWKKGGWRNTALFNTWKEQKEPPCNDNVSEYILWDRQHTDRQEILGKLPGGHKARATRCWH